MAKPIILTVEGLAALEQELETLKTVTRKEVSEKIKVALSFGDLSENSEYDEAKNEQAMVEARVNEIEQMFKNVTVVDEDGLSTDIVGIGSKVKVLNIEKDKEIEYKIVGSTEAAPLERRISDESPVGKALLGHRLNDTVEVLAPSGALKFKIIEIGK
ncbi:MAG: transcription elongation factor GreA [Oscillospiraceae bacterium]